MVSEQLAPDDLHEKSVVLNLPVARTSTRFLWACLGAILLLAASGTGLGLWLRHQWIGQPYPSDGYNVYFVLFARSGPAGLALVMAFTIATAVWLRLGTPARTSPLSLRPRFTIVLMAFAAFALTAAGYFVVFHAYSLTADEYMANFQARIFLHGKLRAVLPEFWWPMVRLVIPTHAGYFPELHAWNSSYLPVYAAIRAPFMAVSLQSLVNPIFAGISVLTIAAITHKVWPEDRWRPIIAAALLACSSQFLVMSMTAYAMPAHLALNLIWLWLYLEPAKRRFWLAPLVGAAALGLHQPFFHALFVAPFLARLVWQRRWKASLYFAAVYLLGIIAWFQWWHHFMPEFNGTGSAGTFGLHRYTWMIQTIYLCLLLGWLALPIPILAALGFARFRKLSPFLQDAALSCVLTFGFYIFVRADQAHGWGDRYFHGTLGCLILVALAGWDPLCQRLGKPAAATYVTVGVVASFFVQFPWRCVQAENFVAPYAHAAELFHSPDVDIVAFNPLQAWYSADLVRNDPFLEKHPIVTHFLGMTEAQAKLLQKTFPRQRVFTQPALKRLGLATENRPK